MPTYHVESCDQLILQNAMVVDTNVLVSAFCEEEEHHEDARYFISEWDAQFVISSAVIVETWGFIVGSRKRREAGLDFINWLLNPGSNLVVISTPNRHFEEVHETLQSLHIDCVDALIAQLAHDITVSCSMRPPVTIVSYDSRDFTLQQIGSRFKFELFDMKSIAP